MARQAPAARRAAQAARRGGTGGTGGSTGGAGGTGGSTGGAGGVGGGMGGHRRMMNLGGLDQIAAVRAEMDGSGLDLPVSGVYVTYTKPVLASCGRLLSAQAEGAGPAIFVAIDPASLTPEPQVGDEVEFTVGAVATVSGVKEVTGDHQRGGALQQQLDEPSPRSAWRPIS
ncbi:MAG: hypothetical protein R3B70_15350 [Polyangiaceae bacterium]